RAGLCAIALLYGASVTAAINRTAAIQRCRTSRLPASHFTLHFPTFPFSLSAKVSEHSLYELIRRPRARVGAVSSAEALDRIGLSDLLERHTLTDQRLDAIANDGHHVAIVHDVRFVADEAMPRHDDRAPFLPDERNRRHGDGDDAIQAV